MPEVTFSEASEERIDLVGRNGCEDAERALSPEIGGCCDISEEAA
jgi:hypothetical protein